MEHLQPTPDPRDPSRQIVIIPVHSSPGSTVVMFAEDHARWVSEHGVRNLHIRSYGANSYVQFKVKATRRDVILARYILGHPLGRQVSTVDRDCLNLRRTNLTDRAGGRAGIAKAKSAAAGAAYRASIDLANARVAAWKAANGRLGRLGAP